MRSDRVTPPGVDLAANTSSCPQQPSYGPTEFAAPSRVTAGLVLALSLILHCGCRKYTEVRSEEGLNIVRSLYTACSSRNADRLATVEIRIQSAIKAGDIQQLEADDLLSIVELARAGNWEHAVRESYRYAKDQVR